MVQRSIPVSVAKRFSSDGTRVPYRLIHGLLGASFLWEASMAVECCICQRFVAGVHQPNFPRRGWNGGATGAYFSADQRQLSRRNRQLGFSS